MPRRRRNTRLCSRQTSHPYGTSAEPAEVIVIEDDGVPTPPPPTPVIVIHDDNAVPAEAPVETPAEAPVETPAEEPIDVAPAEDAVEGPAEDVAEDVAEGGPAEDAVEGGPAEDAAECVICQEGGTLVDSNCHECHVKVHQTCLDNWLFPRLNEPACPHCRTIMVLSELDMDGIRQRKRAGMTEAVSNPFDQLFSVNLYGFIPIHFFSFDCYRCLASIVSTCVPYVGGPGFTGTPLT